MRDQFGEPSNILPINISQKKITRGGEILNFWGKKNSQRVGGQFRRVKKEKKETLNLSLLQAAARPPSLNPLVSSPSPIC